MRILNEKFADLGMPRRIWAVAALHGNINRLAAVHDYIADMFSARDRIVYLGNYVDASSPSNADVYQELLAFRSALLCKPGVEASDIIYLRGTAEESWQRLLRLQFAPAPAQILRNLLTSGVEAYLRLYDISLNEASTIARAGSVAITRWTTQLRAQQRKIPGHEALSLSMRRAAFTSGGESAPLQLLFVPSGFDSLKKLEEQGDALWWPDCDFALYAKALNQYRRVVRGFDFTRSGLQLEGQALTLDTGGGIDTPLICGCFDAMGKMTDIIAAGDNGAVDSVPYEDENI